MNKIFISALALIALIPAQIMAAFTSPADVYRALVASKGMPQQFEATFFGEAEGITVSGAINGQVSGTTIATVQMNADASVSIESPDITATFDASMRFADETLYVRVSSDHPEFTKEAAQIGLTDRTWLKFNIGEMMSHEMGADLNEFEAMQKEAEAYIAELFDALFDMSSANIAGGAEYTLTLKPNLGDATGSLVDILQTIDPISDNQLEEATDELRMFLEELGSSFYVKMKVVANSEDMVTSQKLYTTVEVDEFSGALESTSTVLSEPVVVFKPADRLTINLWESVYSPNVDVEYYQQTDDGEWEEWDGAVEEYDEWTDEDWEAWEESWAEEDAWQAEQMVSDDDPCGAGMWGRTSSNGTCEQERYQEPAVNCAELEALTRPSTRTLELLRTHCQ